MGQLQRLGAVRGNASAIHCLKIGKINPPEYTIMGQLQGKPRCHTREGEAKRLQLLALGLGLGLAESELKFAAQQVVAAPVAKLRRGEPEWLLAPNIHSYLNQMPVKDQPCAAGGKCPTVKMYPGKDGYATKEEWEQKRDDLLWVERLHPDWSGAERSSCKVIKEVKNGLRFFNTLVKKKAKLLLKNANNFFRYLKKRDKKPLEKTWARNQTGACPVLIRQHEAFMTQACGLCGLMGSPKLGNKAVCCRDCSSWQQRDPAAARNILLKGLIKARNMV
ncbi:unnamed protein product [Chrysoparadoxa australica]